jgi:O-antigen/teichoic acid export membrane protein
VSSLKQNILANFIGKGWTVLIGLIFVSFYIRFLGIEAYGLVGFYVALQSMLNILDFGLSTTINREMARYSVQPEKADEARDLARSLEVLYWVIGAIIAVGLYYAGPWIASDWVKLQTLPTGMVQKALSIMGIAIALQWPGNLYNGGLLGLERLVLQNSVIAFCSVLRNVGAVLALWLITPSLVVFFSWQIFANSVQALMMAFSFWWSMPKGSRPARCNINSLRSVWRFTVSMGASGLAGLLLSQIDKVILSNILSMSNFAYYTLATQVNGAVRMSTNSIFSAFLPRMSALTAKRDERELRSLYHQVCQLVSAVIMPMSAVIAFYSFEIIEIWMRDATIAQAAAPIASVLVMGSVFSSMIGVPFDLTIARGWATYGLYQNTLAAVVLVPIIIALARTYNGIGAAFAWLILNIGLFAISAPIIHHRVLRGELLKWFVRDNATPLILSVIVSAFGWWLMPKGLGYFLTLSYIGISWLVTFAICVAALPHVRRIAFDTIHRLIGITIMSRKKG